MCLAVNARQPIVPGNAKDPGGITGLVSKSQKDFTRRINAVTRGVIGLVKELDYNKVQVNKSFVVVNGLNVDKSYSYCESQDLVIVNHAKRELRVNEFIYDYDLNPMKELALMQTISDMIDRLFMVDVDGNLVQRSNGKQLWFFGEYVEPAYAKGTGKEYANLSNQSTVYANTAPSVEAIFMSPTYQKRINLLASKNYTVIKGFSDDMKRELGTILGDGIALGKSPRDISQQIQSRMAVQKSRADLISRTEVPMALRQAGWDESQSADVNLGIKTKQMHMSAFAPTSRPNHIARSGGLYTIKQIKEWYSTGGNRYNCLCTQIATLVDDAGNPLSTGAIDKVKKLKADYEP